MNNLRDLMILSLVSLVASGLGWWRTVYFISLGYGLAIAAIAVAVGVMFHERLDWLMYVQLALLFTYGIRLGTFLAIRELKTSYRDQADRPTQVKPIVKLAIWISCTILYILMTSPGWLHAANDPQWPARLSAATLFAGLIVMLGGLVIESLADRQKSEFKKTAPKQFCNVGLYRIVRSPNYLGEILFWLGNFLAAMPFYMNIWQWLCALIGLVCIVLIMLGSARRLEISQSERYGADPVFAQYSATVPILFPFAPIYSLKNLKVYLG